MLLSDLLRVEVVDEEGHRIGRLQDIGLRLLSGQTKRLEVRTLLCGSGINAERLGYAHGAVEGPWPIRPIMRRRARRIRVARWDDVVRIEHDLVVLRRQAEERHFPREDA